MRENLLERRFGRLVLKERICEVDAKGRKRAKWVCKCDCGNFPKVSEDALKRGLTRSCGCLHREIASAQGVHDLTGRTFGRLTIIERLGTDDSGAATWLVRCNCGEEKSIRGTSLTWALTESCGCLQKEVVSLPQGMSQRNIILRGYINNAKTRNLEWCLTDQQFDELTKGDCHYCGIPPSNTVHKKRYVGSFTYNGIDRKDSAQGYTLGNVVSCCKFCQYAKLDWTYEEFLTYLRRAGQFQLSKG